MTDAQAEVKKNSSYVDALIQNIENQCDMLGPGISDLVSPFIHVLFSHKHFQFINFYLHFLLPFTFHGFPVLQCKQYVSQYAPQIVQQVLSMVSLLSSCH